MSKEAMKLACKALMDCHYYMINAGLPNQSLLNEAFTAYMELEAALAEQPAQQELVAWQYRDARDDGTWGAWLGCDKRLAEDKYRQVRPLYTSPPTLSLAQRKPLTHEQRVDLLAKFEAHKHEWHAPAILIDMVEAAHGIKENA
jgi:hypothetical protein